MNQSTTSISQWVHFRQLLSEMLRVMLTYPQWLAGAIVTTIITASLSPTMALVSKKTIDELQKGKVDLQNDLLRYLLLFGGIFFGLAALKVFDKIVDKIYETKLIIALQRTYLRRRSHECETEDIARIVYDCNRAKAGLDIIHKDAWKIIFQIVSVLVFQITIAPAWLPALAIAVLPPVLIGFFFGPSIKKTSEGMLKAQGNLVKYTSAAQDSLFINHQESFFRQVIRMEVLKTTLENLMDLMTWIGLLAIVLLAATFKVGLLPEKISAGDLALFYINLNLLSKPLGDVVKVYNKCQEAYPALVRVLLPESAIYLLGEPPQLDLSTSTIVPPVTSQAREPHGLQPPAYPRHQKKK
jgi:ABC-type multidrug transport system fused ATPase/permease subunit